MFIHSTHLYYHAFLYGIHNLEYDGHNNTNLTNVGYNIFSNRIKISGLFISSVAYLLFY